MLRVTDLKISGRLIEGERTLILNVTDKDDWTNLSLLSESKTRITANNLLSWVDENQGVTCVCFKGEGLDIEYISYLSQVISLNRPSIKVAICEKGHNKDGEEIYSIKVITE